MLIIQFGSADSLPPLSEDILFSLLKKLRSEPTALCMQEARGGAGGKSPHLEVVGGYDGNVLVLHTSVYQGLDVQPGQLHFP